MGSRQQNKRLSVFLQIVVLLHFLILVGIVIFTCYIYTQIDQRFYNKKIISIHRDREIMRTQRFPPRMLKLQQQCLPPRMRKLQEDQKPAKATPQAELLISHQQLESLHARVEHLTRLLNIQLQISLSQEASIQELLMMRQHQHQVQQLESELKGNNLINVDY